MAYHLLVINGHGNADAVCEGLVTYTGADWALACGRWAIRYMEQLSANLVMPGIWIMLYALCSAFSTVLLARLWDIRGKLQICLIACLLTVNPTVIEQSLLQYMFMAWGISNLLSVAVVCFCFLDGNRIKSVLPAALCMCLAFGLYQSCVGMICACFCMTLIIRLLRGGSAADALRHILAFAVTALLGTALYFAILRVEIVRRGVEESGRVEMFSLSTLFSSLPTTIPKTFQTYARYFYDYRMKRVYFYALIFAGMGICVLGGIIRAVRQRRVLEALLVSVLALSLPVISSIADIIFPYNTPVLIMQYQCMLVIPFAMALPGAAAGEGQKARRVLVSTVSVLSACLLWGYIVSANATYSVYELSYRHMNFVVSSALEDVYELEDYSEDDVIAFAGFPDDDLLRMAVPAYRLAYGQYDSFIFWDGLSGLQTSRRAYLLNYFGIDGGHIYGHLYNNAVASDEFKQMPIWPNEGSVKRLNHLVIIKFSEDPPIF